MTDLDLRAGHIHRGLGVVARWPNIALVIPSDPGHDGAVDEMFASLSPEPTSREVIRAINQLLADNALNSVGMVVEATGGPMAVAYGPVEILVDGLVALSGSEGLVKEQVSANADTMTIRAANTPKAADAVPPFDLRRGVAPGGGISMPQLKAITPPAPSGFFDDSADSSNGHSVGASVAPALEPAGAASGSGASPAVDSPYRSVLLANGEPPSEELPPLPIANSDGPGTMEAPFGTNTVQVEGVLCPRQHFNNPEATTCMVCGEGIPGTSSRVTGPRPTLGFIVFDDSSSFGLDRSYLIGREPVAANGNQAQLLTITTNNDTLSRTHAELRLVGWSVQLIDLGSTNGSYIWDQANQQWNQMTSGHPVELRSGDTVALGRRTFVFEAAS